MQPSYQARKVVLCVLWLLVAGCWLLTPASALLCECCLSVDPLG